jgi:glycosyltransferase involved in cell wall biosynthesis
VNHIAYITAEYPHPDTPPAGGIGSFIKMMATSLVKNDCRVTIFLCLSSRDQIWYDGNIRIVEIKGVQPSRFSPIKNRFKIRNSIKKHIQKDRIDLIEAPDWEGLHAFCDFKIPVVTRIHGSVTYFNHLQGIPKPRLLYYLEKRAIKKSKKVIAVSEFSGTLTESVFEFACLDFEVVYNGIDTDLFSAGISETSENQNILYFGTLVRKKGMMSLAHIFNAVHTGNPNASLTLIGKDAVDFIEKKSTWEVMKSILTPAALDQVHYKGVVPYEEMSQAISQAAICVFPSFAEAFPISWLEAMAMEKPIVASSIGWAPESIEDTKSGLLEYPEKHKVFAQKINKLLTDASFARQLGKNAKQRVADFFDQKKLVIQNIAVYKNILENE